MMKLFTFIVYTFSLLTVAQAQSGNELLVLHLAAPIEQYMFTVAWGSHIGYTYSGTMSLNVDTTVSIRFQDTINVSVGSYSIAFIIDSIHSQILKVRVKNTGPVGGYIGYYDEPGSGSWFYVADIDSIKYDRMNSAIEILPTIAEATDTVQAAWASSIPFGSNDYEFGGNGWNGMEYDTISMELSPLNSSVSNAKPAIQNLSVQYDPNGLWKAYLSPGLTERELDVMNIVGANIMTIRIPSGLSSIPLPSILSNGIYFVRVGNEMAKFVVMP